MCSFIRRATIVFRDKVIGIYFSICRRRIVSKPSNAVTAYPIIPAYPPQILLHDIQTLTAILANIHHVRTFAPRLKGGEIAPRTQSQFRVISAAALRMKNKTGWVCISILILGRRIIDGISASTHFKTHNSRVYIYQIIINHALVQIIFFTADIAGPGTRGMHNGIRKGGEERYYN